MTGVLSELTCLVLHRPGADADAAEVARFYAHLATANDNLADQASDPTEQARERGYAVAARDHAARLLTSWRLTHAND